MVNVVVYEFHNSAWVIVEEKTFGDFVEYTENTLDRVIWAKLRGISVTESGYDNESGYDKTFVIGGRVKIHAVIIEE